VRNAMRMGKFCKKSMNSSSREIFGQKKSQMAFAKFLSKN